MLSQKSISSTTVDIAKLDKIPIKMMKKERTIGSNEGKRMDFMTGLLVKLSNFCATFLPANFSRYKDELSYSMCEFQNAHKSYEKFFKLNSTFANKIILDIGCGDGGKTLYYARIGPKNIIGIDIDPVKILSAKTFQNDKGAKFQNLQFVVEDAEKTSFDDDQFDICISEDGFEHFPSPQKVLDEVNRMLKPGGRFLILFDPYFGYAGPHLYNWIRFPYAHLLFSDRTMINAARIIAKRTIPRTPRREAPEEQVEREIYQFEHFINKITLRRFKRYLISSPNWNLVCLHTYGRRRIFYPFIHIPFINEMFVSIFCVLEKSPGQRIKPKDFLLKKCKCLRKE